MVLPLTAEYLTKIPLLQGLEMPVLEEIVPRLHVKRFSKRECLIHKGEKSEDLMFLLEGRLLVVDVSTEGRQTGLNFLMPGDFFGELAVIDELPRSATIQAVVPSVVAVLPKIAARKLIFANPVIAERMLKHIALRLRASTDYRALIGIPNAFQRVFSLMVILAKPDAGKQLTIENMPIHEHIALMTNTSRETVTRALQLLHEQKVIEKDNRRIILRLPEQLNIIIQKISKESSSN